jgi:uncharacterized membrane protein YdfJ with MMPL/SSD domain
MIGEGAVLSRLIEQARDEGVELVTLRALTEEAIEAGARRALERLGLTDARARYDLDELRELLSAWRDAKRTAWTAVVGWIVRVALALLVLGLALKLGFVGRIHTS